MAGSSPLGAGPTDHGESHFLLLPRWRGAAPVERALLEGDTETGVCLMAVEAGLDTGGIYADAATAIDPKSRPTSCGNGW